MLIFPRVPDVSQMSGVDRDARDVQSSGRLGNHVPLRSIFDPKTYQQLQIDTNYIHIVLDQR